MKNLNPEHFPKLKSDVLRRLASEWAEDYPIIKEVLLFRGIHGSHKYAIVVTIMSPTITDRGIMGPETIPFFKWSFGGESCNHIQEDLASAYEEDIHIDEVTGTRHLPPEWIWFSGGLEDGLPTDFIVPEVSWLLYERKDEGENSKPPELQSEVVDLLKKARPEIELIYSAMKKDVGFSGQIPDLETKLKEKAKEVFDEKKENFKFIKPEYLDDQKLYIVDPGQPRRDFIGLLLKKIVRKETGITIGGQKLYSTYIN